ncbi:hypothetical protein CKO28_08985 [Rhodovibrio sodomensis]|uniref:HTH gntR-type domain-containing protein n=1 Tax=Rhodovibrio sodomensis TaxID=1088 RepID=A0ABS1DCS9_9PROT|nr:hypothetical protein [Rhodovibrio sodomensis]MBK1668170.1 hypothetical protein [Rhodovibrio sodomensis]
MRDTLPTPANDFQPRPHRQRSVGAAGHQVQGRLQRAVRASARTRDPAAQLVASALAQEMLRTGGLPCRPSLQRLAALSGVHPARAEQALQQLERMRLVARLRLEGAPDVDHFALLCDARAALPESH